MNQRLVDLRKKAGLTQYELAKRVGMRQSMISYVEAGKKEPGKKNRIKLARFFGVSVEWLFYEETDTQ